MNRGEAGRETGPAKQGAVPPLDSVAFLDSAAEPDVVVELRNITKLYPGSPRRVNDSVSLSLMRGEILCLAGENGAGKTTLMKILCGVESPTQGEILLRGRPVKIPSPLEANRLGIGMVYQHFMLFPELTVAQNVVMGIEPRKWGFLYDRKKAEALVNRLIEAGGFSIEAGKPVAALTVGQMQQVEILRLLYRNTDILILDEPTAVLAEQEILSLFGTLRGLAAAGRSLILITHKLGEIKAVSHRVAVMRKGRLVGIRETGGIDEPDISRMMIGGEGEAAPEASAGPAAGTADGKAGKKSSRAGPELIRFEHVSVRRRGQKQLLLDDVSFAVHAGEILGFAGVGGNGLGVLEAVLGGFLSATGGKIFHRGRDITGFNNTRLREEGLAYVPADRLRVGSAPAAGIDDNIIINRRKEFSPFGFFDSAAVSRFAGDLTRRYGISGGGRLAGTLSGGNVQKMILAREIDSFRDYIVFSEPTWGLDIAAGAYLHREIRSLRNRGAAVILISTNLDEILALADRIIVFYRGRIGAELGDTRIPNIKEKIGAAMLGSFTPG
ncbi:MAG: ATP-binding cassette domain-containing protein [Treponema sp.]|jgi:simple sugar transport system ATP-binding protein|nr:ATP-binding cassette domain-containing protein [Treponema sp.]